MSIPNGIQYPAEFYIQGSSWRSAPPTGYSWYNLWSANNTTTGFNDNVVVKTVYDPCPAGFKMPAPNAFTGFSKTGGETSNPADFNVSGTWDYGWNFNNKLTAPDATIYFPASGYYYGYDGSLDQLMSGGHYWTAGPYGGYNYCAMGFASQYVIPHNQPSGENGAAVRPVKDE